MDLLDLAQQLLIALVTGFQSRPESRSVDTLGAAGHSTAQAGLLCDVVCTRARTDQLMTLVLCVLHSRLLASPPSYGHHRIGAWCCGHADCMYVCVTRYLRDTPLTMGPTQLLRGSHLSPHGACGYNRPCAHQYVGKSQSCMVENGRLIPHALYEIPTPVF